jgi:hypothetical protein
MPGTRSRQSTRGNRGRPASSLRRRTTSAATHPRVQALHDADSNLVELARLADRAYRVAQRWAAEEIDSPACDAAFRKLTGRVA